MKQVTTYYTAWDWFSWSVIIFTFAICLLSVICVNVLLAIIMAVFFVVIEAVVFLSTYYEVCEDELIVHSSFKVAKYPIDKIKEIKPTNSWLAAPAASLSKRIAITFTDKNVLRSSIPLIISPARQSEFIHQLLSINPDIKY